MAQKESYGIIYLLDDLAIALNAYQDNYERWKYRFFNQWNHDFEVTFDKANDAGRLASQLRKLAMGLKNLEPDRQIPRVQSIMRTITTILAPKKGWNEDEKKTWLTSPAYTQLTNVIGVFGARFHAHAVVLKPENGARSYLEEINNLISDASLRFADNLAMPWSMRDRWMYFVTYTKPWAVAAGLWCAGVIFGGLYAGVLLETLIPAAFLGAFACCLGAVYSRFFLSRLKLSDGLPFSLNEASNEIQSIASMASAFTSKGAPLHHFPMGIYFKQVLDEAIEAIGMDPALDADRELLILCLEYRNLIGALVNPLNYEVYVTNALNENSSQIQPASKIDSNQMKNEIERFVKNTKASIRAQKAMGASLEKAEPPLPIVTFFKKVKQYLIDHMPSFKKKTPVVKSHRSHRVVA